VTFVAAVFLSPTAISSGFLRTCRARASTCVGSVALNMATCLSGRVACRNIPICGSKPMSNIRSASSSTRNDTLLKFVILPPEVVRTSISLPGVPTRISAPLFSAASCSPMGPPP